MISIPIITEFDGSGIKRAIKQFKQLETTSEKAQFAIKKAAIPAAAALTAVVALIGKSVQGAIEDEAAQASLARQVKASAGATDAQVAALEEYISSLGRTVAVSDDEARPAFQNLIVATHDITKATELMNLATDVAAATGKPLVDVTDALSKAYAGNMKGLNTLSPEVKAMIKDGASLAEVQKVLQANFGGAGKAAADTAAGGMKKLRIAFNETTEGIGAAFLPIMLKVLPVVTKFSAWAQANPNLLAAVTAGMGALAIAVNAVNAAMALNPAMLITAGVVVLTGAIVVAYKKFETFGDVMRVVGNSVVGYFEGIVNGFIKVINAVIYGINLLKPGNNIDKLSEVTLPRLTKEVEKSTIAIFSHLGVIKAEGEAYKWIAPAIDKKTGSTKKLNEALKKAKERAAAARQQFEDLGAALKAKLGDEITAATSKLDALRNQFESFADTVKSAILSGANFGAAQSKAISNSEELKTALQKQVDAQLKVNDADAKYQSFQDRDNLDALILAQRDLAKATNAVADAAAKPMTFFDNLTTQAAKAKDFGVLVNRLVAAGLSDAALSQVLAAGSDGGAAIANEILNSADGVLKANTLTKDLSDLADTIAKNSASHYYGAGVSAAESYLQGLNETLKHVEITFADPRQTAANAAAANYMTPSIADAYGPILGSINASQNMDGSGASGAINITVNAGLVSSPAQVGQDIIRAIQQAQRTSGDVFAPA